MSRPGWPVPVLWPGQTGVLVAGGPSLTLAAVRHIGMARLANKCRVFCVNDAIYPCWFADWLHGCDFKWWDWHKESGLKFPGIKTTCTEMVPAPWAHYVHCLPPDPETGNRFGFAEEPDAVVGGGNGAYQTIQLMVKAGIDRVLMIGVDMTGENGPHWFGDHPDRIRSDYESTMLPSFPTLVEPLKQRGVEIINCSLESKIECFPKARLEDVL